VRQALKEHTFMYVFSHPRSRSTVQVVTAVAELEPMRPALDFNRAHDLRIAIVSRVETRERPPVNSDANA
jgi:hypothetical protein